MKRASQSYLDELPTAARHALYTVAVREVRTHHQQAAKYIIEGLRREGHLTEEQYAPADRSEECVPA